MKKFHAEIQITLRKGILDVQGKAVENALHSIDFNMLSNVRIGKYIELSVEAESKEQAHQYVTDASNQLIANPIIEDFRITLSEIN